MTMRRERADDIVLDDKSPFTYHPVDSIMRFTRLGGSLAFDPGLLRVTQEMTLHA
jgi:hypothetical protein